MTEAERIVASGIVTPDFLKEETKCDFVVDSQRKKVWAIELELLLELDRVCKKHKLRYYLMCGTLLGAIRHKGFIPWDDDADVAMPREDYEKFIRLQDEFKHPFFLQTPYTDKGFAVSHTCIRNSNTSAISPIISYQEMNHGIFIDVFPLDHYEDSDARERYAKINQLNIENGTFMRMTNPQLNEKNQQRVAAYNRDHIADYEEIQRLASMYNGKETKQICIMTYTADPLENNIWDSADFADTIDWEYEGHKFPIPAGYDHILKGAYGNYMEFPPPEQRGILHGHYILEPDIPYKDFLKKYHSV